MASRPPRPKPLDWVTPPHLTVFIRNLKLLQLDLRDDWPDITLRTLSSSSQNQRQRIRLVEWALYYLFTIWDPEYALNKLRPFFPPLEPLQSVNLRAALFRSLGELKKNGDLGRETILRKTMLDDCRGDKFDELLAVFSTAVLRKLLAVSASDTPWNPALKLSTAATISPTDYQNLLPLVLAHQVSLGAVGGRRTRARETHDQFSYLLDKKKAELTRRASIQSEKALGYKEKTDGADLARELQANWLGSEEWAISLLNGGSHSSTDSFLELPFSKAWARVNESSVDDLGTDAKSNLVIDLEARVLRLRSRLRRWHEYNDSLQHERTGNSKSAGVKSSEFRVQFRDHQAMTVASISKAVRQPEDRGRSLREADQSFISTVNEAIGRINGNPEIRSVAMNESLERQSPSPSPHLPEELHDRNMPLSPLDAQPTNPLPTFSPPEVRKGDYQEDMHSSPPIVRLSPDQSSTDQLDLDLDQNHEPELEPLKQKPQNHTLVERTRKSMSLIPPLPAHENPRPHRRGPRPSFPINQFETPRKTSQPGSLRSGASTPQDQLFEEDADYASVFKSRPRVALSPISSPAVHVSPSFDEDDGFDLVYDDDDDDDAELKAVDSPLAGQRVRRL